jgi:hypothetical protein
MLHAWFCDVDQGLHLQAVLNPWCVLISLQAGLAGISQGPQQGPPTTPAAAASGAQASQAGPSSTAAAAGSADAFATPAVGAAGGTPGSSTASAASGPLQQLGMRLRHLGATSKAAKLPCSLGAVPLLGQLVNLLSPGADLVSVCCV